MLSYSWFIVHFCHFKMEEKQRVVAAKKAEQDAYDRKMQQEIANYNPFGRAGAGAPMKDHSGNVVG